MRHGRPQIHLEALRHIRKSPAETGQIIRDYEFTNIDFEQDISTQSIEIAQASQQIFSSDMLRSINSVKMLRLETKAIANGCFRESAHPYYTWSKPKLKFFTWCILFRLMWFVGFAKNGESIKLARKRAQIGADILQQAAQVNDDVMLMGHGFINRLITAKLKKMGWQLTQSTGSSYWNYVVLHKN